MCHWCYLGVMAAAAAEAAETGARAGGRSHPEAEMLAAAGGSEGTPVNLCVTNVYNSSSSEISSLETTNTIADLKRLLQEAIPSRPAPHQQRLIFRGKQCEETQQLGHVLRGVSRVAACWCEKAMESLHHSCCTISSHGPLRSVEVPCLLWWEVSDCSFRCVLQPPGMVSPVIGDLWCISHRHYHVAVRNSWRWVHVECVWYCYVG